MFFVLLLCSSHIILISFSLIQRIVMWKMTGMGDLLSAVEKKSCRNNIFFRKRYDLQVTRLNNRCICFHLLSRLKIKRKYMISCGSMSWVGRIPWQKKHGRHRAIYAMISLSIPLVIFSLLSTRAILRWTWDNVLSCTKGLFTWSGGPRSSGVSFFCFHALGDTKQKKLTPLDWGPPLRVNRV